MPIYPSSSTPIDNTTIATNAAGQLEVKPTSISVVNNNQNITYSSNTTLTSDVYANNVTINSGVTVTTNGYNFYCTGAFVNNGTINTGYNNSGGAGGSPSGGTGGSGAYGLYIQAASITAGVINANGAAGGAASYGGGGGGGGGGVLIFATNGTYNAGTYNVSGGSGGAYGTTTGPYNGGNGGSTAVATGGTGTASGGAGGNATSPSLTIPLIISWYTNGMVNYLCGGGGGGGGSTNSAGSAGTSYSKSYGGAGGGGGQSYAYPGGSGGSGIAVLFNGLPIPLNSFTYSTNQQSIKNKISGFQFTSQTTTSTTPITASSLNITPTTTGTIAIRAVCKVSNNTIGDGVQVLLYNGSTLIDFDTYTQEGLANNPHYITLYAEQQFTPPYSQQTYSIQFNAITGGTASCEIQEFSLEEIY